MRIYQKIRLVNKDRYFGERMENNSADKKDKKERIDKKFQKLCKHYILVLNTREVVDIYNINWH